MDSRSAFPLTVDQPLASDCLNINNFMYIFFTDCFKSLLTQFALKQNINYKSAMEYKS